LSKIDFVLRIARKNGKTKAIKILERNHDKNSQKQRINQIPGLLLIKFNKHPNHKRSTFSKF